MSGKRKNIVLNNNKLLFFDDSPVFKFINPNSNDYLSKMSGFDLQNLIILMDEYYIKLRNYLGFAQYITFGLELEFENAMKDRIDRQLKKTFPNGDWIIKDDASLYNGAEINSPILRDNKTTWKN